MRALMPLLLALCTSVVACTVHGEPADLHQPSDASIDVENDASTDGASDDGGDASADGPSDSAPDDALLDSGSDTDGETESGPTGSCATATELEVPSVGDAATLVVELVGAEAELTGTCGGSNVERVVRLQPTEDAAVLITAGGTSSFTPVLYVLADQCVSGVSAEELACQSGANPQIMSQLEAGRTYFVVVDSNGASANTSTVLTILRLG